MTIVDIKSKNSLNLAIDVLKSDGIIIFPTDTVYGIGCLMNDDTIKKLYKIKNRPLSKPTAILITEETVSDLRIRVKCSTVTGSNDIYNRFKNGTLTLVLEKDFLNIKVPEILVKNNKVGLRIPNYEWLKILINQVGPIVASSANKKGERTPEKFKDLSPEILEKADLVIKTSIKLSGQPSAIYDLENNKIIRN